MKEQSRNLLACGETQRSPVCLPFPPPQGSEEDGIASFPRVGDTPALVVPLLSGGIS